MTFADAIAARRYRLGYFLHIEGIPVVLKTHAGIDASTILGDDYTEVVAFSEELFNIGTESIDYKDRIVKGGGLTLTVIDPAATRVLRDLVQPRRRRAAFLMADVTRTGTTITPNSVAPFTAGDVIYIGGESILVDSVGATTLTVSRAQYESIGEPHVAGALDGEAIYLRPASWKGRRVTLYACALDYHEAAGIGDATPVGFFALAGPPHIVGPDTWSIECDPYIERFLEARIGSGITDVEASNIPAAIVGGGAPFTVDVVDPSQFAIGTKETYVRLEGSGPFDGLTDGKALARLQGVSGSQVQMDNGVAVILRPDKLTEIKSARHIAIVGGGFALLELLCSTTGAGTGFDTLPGAERATRDGRTWRFGAGISTSELDTLVLSSDRRAWWYPVTGEVEVAEVLKDWCLTQDLLAVVGSDGRLTMRRLSSDENDSTFYFDETVLADEASVKIEPDESSIYTAIRVKANYSPVTDKFLFDDVIKDFDLQARFPHRTDELTIELRGLGVDVESTGMTDSLLAGRPRGISRGELEGMMRQLQVRGGRTPIRVAFSYGLQAYNVCVGDVVTINFPSWPDLEGGSLAERTARVVERRARWKDGVFDFVVEVLDKLFKIAPSAIISGFSTTTVLRDTITLSSSNVGSSADADQDFDVVGLNILCWDASAGTSTQHTVAARVSATQLRITPGLPATVSPGEDWITWDVCSSNASLSPTNGDEEDDWAIQQPADGTDAAAGENRRWR